MQLAAIIRQRRAQILALARDHGAEQLQVFHSAVAGDDWEDSDINFLVRMQPGRTLLDMRGLASELEALLGRRIDLVSEGSLHGELGQRILQAARPL